MHESEVSTNLKHADINYSIISINNCWSGSELLVGEKGEGG